MTKYSQEEIHRIRGKYRLESYFPERGFDLRKAGHELACLCPFHTEKSPSCHVNPEKQVWKCHGCNAGGDLLTFVQKLDRLDFTGALEKLGAHAEDDSPPRRPEPAKVSPQPGAPVQQSRIIATYSYTDATGAEVFQAIRLEPKSFRQRRKLPDGKWAWNLDGVETVLYRLPEVIESECVWVVEGEKDADAFAEFGLVATCNPMGAGKWRESYTAALRGKIVVLCGDTDAVGVAHMDAVEKAVSPVARCVKRIRLPEPHKDVSDYLAAGTTRPGSMHALMDLMDAAPELYNGIELPLQSMEELERDYREFVKHADTRAVNLSLWMPAFSALRPVVPGELVFILAQTGAGKTAALQNIAAALPNLPTLFFELELPGTLTFERFAALATETSAREVWGAYRAGKSVPWANTRKLDHVYVCSKSGIKVSDIERYITLAHLKTGHQPAVVMVDYVGLIHGEGKSRYERTSSVAEELKVLAKRTNTVVICASQVTRDKDNESGEVSLFSGKDSGSIENSSGLLLGLWRDNEDAERTYIRVLKSTKGGGGLTVNCDFDGATMQMTQAAEQPLQPMKKPRKKPPVATNGHNPFGD